MQLLFDFLPILAFFIAYKFKGLFVATGLAIGISVVQVAIHWVRTRQIARLQFISMIIIILLGSATLLLHNELFIKWKPTVLYWVFALFFLGSQLFGKKNCIQYLMDQNIALTPSAWRKLNISWIIFFTCVGFINLYVVYHFSTDVWVNFKLFGILGMTFLFIIAQAFYLASHLKQQEKQNEHVS